MIMVSFCAVLFPRDVLDEIVDLIESVSEGFLSHSYNEFKRDQQFFFSNLLKKQQKR